MNLAQGRSQGLLRKEPEYFSSGEYLLGILKRAIASQSNVEISLGTMGNVSLFPSVGVYFASASDMPEFCRAPASRFKTTALSKDICEPRHHASSARNISEILWQAAFHASRGRLVESRSSGEPVQIYDVIKFHHWPNLTRLPMTPNTMRIFALLTRQPSSIVLVPRKLGVEPEEVFQVYSAACSSGIVHVVRDHLGQADLDDQHEAVGPIGESGFLHSLFTKIMGL